MKNISFLSEISQFLEVNFSIYLNRHVFVMMWSYKDVNSLSVGPYEGEFI